LNNSSTHLQKVNCVNRSFVPVTYYQPRVNSFTSNICVIYKLDNAGDEIGDVGLYLLTYLFTGTQDVRYSTRVLELRYTPVL